MAELKNKDDLLEKLCLFASCPDDDNVIFKKKIEDAFMHCPEILYAVNEKTLESELFNKDGTINYDGEWDKFFTDSSHEGNFRPYLFSPEAQEDVRNYVCYQTHFDESPRYNGAEKYCLVTFTIFVHEGDRIDAYTGLPRHDLISAIIQDKFNWSNIFGTQCHVVSNKESLTDYKYIVRTLVFMSTMPNNIVQTTIKKNGGISEHTTNVINKLGRM